MKLIFITLALATTASFVYSKRSLGAPSKVHDAERIELLLNDHIDKLNLTIVRINNVQQQIVSGIIYKVNGIFKNSDGEYFNCDVDLWIQEWLEDDNEKVKISLQNQQKLENFDESLLLSGSKSSSLRVSHFLCIIATTLFLTLQ